MKIQTISRAVLKKVLIGGLLVATTVTLTQPPQAWAMLAPSTAISATSAANSSREADLKTIQATLESKVLRQRLSEFKLTPDQINQRMSKMSDAQIHQLASKVRTINPGGDAGLGIIVALLVIGILVVLFVYLFKRV